MRRLSVLCLGLWPLACGTNNTYHQNEYIYSSQPDAGAPTAPAPDEEVDPVVPVPPKPEPEPDPSPVPDAGPPPIDDGLPVVNTEPQALVLDVFGSMGSHYYFVVSETELERMNERYLGGGFPGIFGGDIYTPGGGGSDVTFVERLLVSTPGAAPSTADFGKVQVRLVGESTGRPWTPNSLPNFKIDSDEFTPGNRVAGVKHLRLNNAIVGSIFREKLTLDLYAKLGYAAPRANYAWVSSSVWGPDVSVPYIVVEAYKPQFCKQHEAELAGGCVNMWEFVGDLGSGALGYEESCQFSECEPTRALAFELDAVETPPGAGYKEALSKWVDWDAFHRFQCLSWVLATGDDALHNTNNHVLVERADGKFQHLPYSIDISLGQEWYSEVPLAGISTLARGCQSDTQCWADLIATCEGVIEEFTAANPMAMLDQTYAALAAEGMLRSGDEARYRSLSSYLARRLTELPVELEENRAGPPPEGYCEYPFILCGDYCSLPDECFVCEPEPQPEPLPGLDGGVEPDFDGIERAALDIALPPGGAPVPRPPAECLPPLEIYDGPRGFILR